MRCRRSSGLQPEQLPRMVLHAPAFRLHLAGCDREGGVLGEGVLHLLLQRSCCLASGGKGIPRAHAGGPQPRVRSVHPPLVRLRGPHGGPLGRSVLAGKNPGLGGKSPLPGGHLQLRAGPGADHSRDREERGLRAGRLCRPEDHAQCSAPLLALHVVSRAALPHYVTGCARGRLGSTEATLGYDPLHGYLLIALGERAGPPLGLYTGEAPGGQGRLPRRLWLDWPPPRAGPCGAVR
mmetsp:Transcript_85690/g.227680  ORF Transcript_85690/g.227680 Transcript_85690/m.227680 type:complete len:236 (-) Transcript_85690:816-1523(-)